MSTKGEGDIANFDLHLFCIVFAKRNKRKLAAAPLNLNSSRKKQDASKINWLDLVQTELHCPKAGNKKSKVETRV